MSAEAVAPVSTHPATDHAFSECVRDDDAEAPPASLNVDSTSVIIEEKLRIPEHGPVDVIQAGDVFYDITDSHYKRRGKRRHTEYGRGGAIRDDDSQYNYEPENLAVSEASNQKSTADSTPLGLKHISFQHLPFKYQDCTDIIPCRFSCKENPPSLCVQCMKIGFDKLAPLGSDIRSPKGRFIQDLIINNVTTSSCQMCKFLALVCFPDVDTSHSSPCRQPETGYELSAFSSVRSYTELYRSDKRPKIKPADTTIFAIIRKNKVKSLLANNAQLLREAGFLLPAAPLLETPGISGRKIDFFAKRLA